MSDQMNKVWFIWPADCFLVRSRLVTDHVIDIYVCVRCVLKNANTATVSNGVRIYTQTAATLSPTRVARPARSW